jgi:hypothetical protein
VYPALLTCHIAAGAVALLAAAAALLAAKGGRRHIQAGRTFAVAMLVVVLTAIPITAIRPNLFLFLVAIFSGYLVATGWLRARNRDGVATPADRVVVAIMVTAAVAMAGVGLARIGRPGASGVVLIVFSGIGGTFALADLVALRRHSYRGANRIAAHLTRMLAGTIAAVTAVTVVNVHTDPAALAWLAPTVVLTPLIVYWNRRVLGGAPGPVATKGASRSHSG